MQLQRSTKKKQKSITEEDLLCPACECRRQGAAAAVASQRRLSPHLHSSRSPCSLSLCREHATNSCRTAGTECVTDIKEQTASDKNSRDWCYIGICTKNAIPYNAFLKIYRVAQLT